MTLVVGRFQGDRIAIASDTMLSEHGRPLPFQHGCIKSCMLPGDICVSFSNSPELAARDFKTFADTFPSGTQFSDTISFFEKSSQRTGNDYLLAFSQPPKLATIANGHRIETAAKTHWIGDKAAYTRFREYETRNRRGIETGRAINAVIFMDEMPKSPASELYSAMRHVHSDRDVPSTGGFVCMISNREGGFRHSVYSDMLFNWPDGETEDFILDLNAQIDFGASGENEDCAVAQLSTGFMGLNLVGFYLLKAKKVFLYHGIKNGLANKCLVMGEVEPRDISQRLNLSVGADLKWLDVLPGNALGLR